MTVTADSTAFLADIREHFAEVLDSATTDLLADMERDAPRDTGAMTQTIEVAESDSGDVLARTITAPAEYASYQDTGTGIYGPTGARIYPKTARFLVFTTKDGTKVFARSVAGTPRTGWWSDKLANWSDYLARAMG